MEQAKFLPLAPINQLPCPLITSMLPVAPLFCSLALMSQFFRFYPRHDSMHPFVTPPAILGLPHSTIVMPPISTKCTLKFILHVLQSSTCHIAPPPPPPPHTHTHTYMRASTQNAFWVGCTAINALLVQLGRPSSPKKCPATTPNHELRQLLGKARPN